MNDSFDALEYLDYLRKRWMFAAVALVLAGVTAVAACLLLPKQYTATATLVIEPPGADPRTSVAVSSVYLESLKSYESFASSDSLFARACARFGLLKGGVSLEPFKRRVLRVEKLRDTKVLQISATLPNPQQAQALVQYLAEATVDLARDLAGNEERELMDGVQKQLDSARQELDRTRAESTTAEAPQLALAREVQSMADRLARAEEDRVEADMVRAESAARGDQQSAAASRAGQAALEASIAAMHKDLDAKSVRLAALNSRKETAEDHLQSAQEAFDRAQKNAEDLSATAMYRSERVRVVDPGVVPQTPSFPNLPLAVVSALVVAGALCLVWLTLQFGLLRQRGSSPKAGLRVAGGGIR